MIKNITKNTVISNDYLKVSGIDKVSGLIGKNNKQALVFNTRFGIHTFFLKYPIDVIILGKNNKINSIKENLKPNRFFFWNPKYDLVIEARADSIRKSGSKIGDIISL